jgi:hypothetical protein
MRVRFRILDLARTIVEFKGTQHIFLIWESVANKTGNVNANNRLVTALSDTTYPSLVKTRRKTARIGLTVNRKIAGIL